MSEHKVLVTGGCGFIGSNFINYVLDSFNDIEIVNIDKMTYASNKKYVKKNSRYKLIEADICKQSLVNDIFQDEAPSVVVHFAAESHVDNSINGPEIFVETNIKGTFNLLEAAKKNKIKKFVHVSTDEVYGTLDRDSAPFTEFSRYQPNSPYAATKAGSDLIARSYRKTYGLNVIITNCSNNFGPHQNKEKFIPTVIKSIANETPIPIYGDGKNIRDWIFVGDHCEALSKVAFGECSFENYNIGGNNEISNLELCKTICSIFDRLHPLARNSAELIHFVKDRPGHDFRYAIENKSITKDFNWNPSKDFLDNLELTIQWYLDEFKQS